MIYIFFSGWRFRYNLRLFIRSGYFIFCATNWCTIDFFTGTAQSLSQKSLSYIVFMRIKISMSVIWYMLSWRHLYGWTWDVYLSLADADFFSCVKSTFVVGRMILLNYENTRPIWLTSVIFLSSSFRTGFSSHFFHVFFFQKLKDNYIKTL